MSSEIPGFRAPVANGPRAFSQSNALEPPETVFLTASNQCNLRCRSCGIWRPSDRPAEPGQKPLSEEEMRRLLVELKAWGVCHIAFDTIGEPFLNRSFLPLVKFAHQQGLFTTTVSNGTLIDPIRAEEIVDSGLDALSLSIDGPDSSVHDPLRGVPGAFQRTIEGVRAVRSAQKRRNAVRPALAVCTVVSKDNYQHLPRMADLLVDLEVAFLKIVYVTVLDATVATNLSLADARHLVKMNEERFALPAPELYVAQSEQARVWTAVEELKTQGASLGMRINVAIDAGGQGRECHAFWEQTFIDVFGNVYPCAMLKPRESMGNIRDHSLADLWNSPVYTQLRQVLRQRNAGQIDLEICRRCCAWGSLIAH